MYGKTPGAWMSSIKTWNQPLQSSVPFLNQAVLPVIYRVLQMTAYQYVNLLSFFHYILTPSLTNYRKMLHVVWLTSQYDWLSIVVATHFFQIYRENTNTASDIWVAPGISSDSTCFSPQTESNSLWPAYMSTVFSMSVWQIFFPPV